MPGIGARVGVDLGNDAEAVCPSCGGGVTDSGLVDVHAAGVVAGARCDAGEDQGGVVGVATEPKDQCLVWAAVGAAGLQGGSIRHSTPFGRNVTCLGVRSRARSA